jgi:hypothetical protein
LLAPEFAELRAKFRAKIKTGSTDMRVILGEQRYATHAADFMAQTGLLQMYNHVWMEPEEL